MERTIGQSASQGGAGPKAPGEELSIQGRTDGGAPLGGFEPGPRAIAAAAIATVLVSLTWTTLLPALGLPLDDTQLDAGQGLLDITVQGLTAGVIAWSARSLKGRGRYAWMTFAVGAALGSVGTSIKVASVLGGDPALASTSELIWGAGLTLTLAGLVLLPSSRLRSRKVRMTDTGILVVAAATIVWILPAHPSLEQTDLRLLQVSTTATLVVAISIYARCRPDLHGEIALAAGAISAIAVRMLVLPPAPHGYPQSLRLADAVTSAALVLMMGAGLRLRGPERAPSRRAQDTDRFLSAPEVATVSTLVALAVHSQLGGSLLVSVVFGGLILSLAFMRLLQLSSEQRHLRRSLRDTAERLHHDARVDSLTGAGNRLALDEHLAALDALVAGGVHSSVAVYFADIDHFKRYNDALGHAVGDALLVEVCRRVAATDDTRMFRAGGDEFVVVAVDRTPTEASDLADELVSCTCDPIEVHGHELAVHLSVGWAVGDPESPVDHLEKLVQRADLALYEAKALGRARHQQFTSTLADQAATARNRRYGLEKALQAGDVDVRFDPVMRLDDRSVAGLLARLWWDSPEYGAIGHHDIAEMTFSSGPLADILMTLMAGAAKALEATADRSGQQPWVGFRVTRAQLLHPVAIEAVIEWLRSPAVDVARVRIEVAEDVLGDEMATEALERVRSTGADLSVERFGAGPPSLLRLGTYPASSICVDRSFVEGIGCDGTDTIILSVLAGLALDLDLEMSADGVSSQAQVDKLIELGFQTARGALFCPGCSYEDLCAGRSPKATCR